MFNDTSVDEALLIKGAGDTDDALLKTVGDGEELRIEECYDGEVTEAFTTCAGSMVVFDSEALLTKVGHRELLGIGAVDSTEINDGEWVGIIEVVGGDEIDEALFAEVGNEVEAGVDKGDSS